MKRAAHSTFKTRIVVENTRIVDPASGVRTISILDQPTIVGTLGMFLPMLWLETLYRLLDRSKIFLVDEVSAIAATTLLQLGRIVIQDALATRSINARPI